MIIGVGENSNTKCTMNFGTHNGIFHCDEVVGIAILEIAHMNTDAYVVRTRNLDELDKLDIVIDIGGGMFDHHMAGFDVCRPTGEKYASAGLVWREFAGEAIKNFIINMLYGIVIIVIIIYNIFRKRTREFVTCKNIARTTKGILKNHH